MTANEILSDTKKRMQKSIDSAKIEMSKVRSGRATENMLDGVSVNYYGTTTPIKQMANIAIPESRLLTITPWDRSQLALIERAILASDLGVTPSNDGSLIRLRIPELTMERRNELAKLVRKFGEDGKISVRNIRRDANDHIKQLQRKSEISEDEEKIYLEDIQNSTNQFISKLDELVKAKESDLLKI